MPLTSPGEAGTNQARVPLSRRFTYRYLLALGLVACSGWSPTWTNTSSLDASTPRPASCSSGEPGVAHLQHPRPGRGRSRGATVGRTSRAGSKSWRASPKQESTTCSRHRARPAQRRSGPAPAGGRAELAPAPTSTPASRARPEGPRLRRRRRPDRGPEGPEPGTISAAAAHRCSALDQIPRRHGRQSTRPSRSTATRSRRSSTSSATSSTAHAAGRFVVVAAGWPCSCSDRWPGRSRPRPPQLEEAEKTPPREQRAPDVPHAR